MKDKKTILQLLDSLIELMQASNDFYEMKIKGHKTNIVITKPETESEE